MAAATQRSHTEPQPAVSSVSSPSRAPAPSPRSPAYLSPGTPALRLGPGEPLRAPVRQRLESSFGADLSAVRVHSGPDANVAANGRGARAFALGNNIVLGSGQSPNDVALMGHEAAHVLQQRGGMAVQTFSTGATDSLEVEASRAGDTAARGGSMSVQGRTSVQPQHDGLLEWAENKMWDMLESYAPELVPILRKGPEGVMDWLKEKITAAIEGMFNNLMAPVRVITGAGQWLSGVFAPLLAWMQDAAAKIARNDCSPLREAADKIEKVVTGIITPIVEKVQAIAGKVGDFFTDLWDKFGAPVWDWIKKYAGEQWNQIQMLATWVWDKTAPIRDKLSRAWTWLKNKLGVGDGPEGQNGILQWVQRKASDAWDWIKEKIEPYKKQLMIVAGVIGGLALLVSPAGPVIIVGGIVVGIIQGVRWIQAHWGKSNLVVQARVFLEKTLFPPLIGAMNRVTAAVLQMAGAINAKLAEVTAGLGRVVGAVASSILRFAVAAMQWVADQFTALAQWGAEKLQALAHWIQEGLARLQAFLQPMLEFFGKVGRLLFDIWALPALLVGRLWEMIPHCIRDPFVDWIVPLILRQIDIFKELVKDNEAWQKTKADVMNIVRLVFVNKDLRGAIKAVFNLILRVFNVPVELLVQVVKKAAVAWDVVTAAPIRFIKNCVRTVGMGLKLYYDHLSDNLLAGLEGWLFAEVAEKGISKPKSWTDPWDLMEFGLQVMGLSMNHVFELMEKKFEKSTVDKLRVWYGRLSKVWDWIMEMRGKKPAEVSQSIINSAKGFGKTIFEGIVVWIVRAVATELSEMAVAAAASAGLSEVLDAIRRIYRAIKTAVRWMRKVLEMINSTLDSVLGIAAGVLAPSATILLNAMKQATPAVIGFLADQVGLGDVGQTIRDIIDSLRAKVDSAILAIIDALKGVLTAIAQGARDLLQWWKKKIGFTSESGQSHSILLDGTPPDVKVVVQSDRAYLEDLVDQITDTDKKKQAQAKRAEIEKIIGKLDRLGARGKVGAGDDDKEVPALDTALEKAMREMGVILASAGVLDKGVVNLPRPTYNFDFSNGRATGASVENLSANRPMGSAPYQNPLGWGYLQDSGQTVSREPFYRRLHLINHRLGGPGQNQNLAPGSQENNSQMERDYEAPIKDLVGDEPMQSGKTAIVWMQVSVSYNHSAKPLRLNGRVVADQSDYPSKILCRWQYQEDPKKRKKSGTTLPLDIPAPK